MSRVRVSSPAPSFRPPSSPESSEAKEDTMSSQTETAAAIEMKLEGVPIPVSDVDAAKAFYTEKVGFHLDNDVPSNSGILVVHMTPPCSACPRVVWSSPRLWKP